MVLFLFLDHYVLLKFDVTARGRRSVALDLKNPAAVETALTLMDKADAVFEGFRPGVMERLGLGPDVALKRNPKLVYGRMTGWGQFGPLRPGRRPRHQLHRHHRRAARDRHRGQAGPAAQPGRRLRRRRALPRVRPAGRGDPRPRHRAGPGDRLRHDRRRGLADVDVLRHDGVGRLDATSAKANMLDGGAHFYDTYECTDGRLDLAGLDRAAVLRAAAGEGRAGRSGSSSSR